MVQEYLKGTREKSFRITPLTTSGAPVSGFHQIGALAVDSNGVFYCCTVSGTPGTWVLLNRSEFSLSVGGAVSGESYPITGLGQEVVLQAQTLTEMRGVREIAGTSGTTTVQLEINGSPVTGATLSWVGGTDPNNTVKSAGAFSANVVPGDRLSFRVTEAEVGDPAHITMRVR